MLLTNEQREQLLQQFDNQTNYNRSWIIRNNISLKDIEVCDGEATSDPTTRTCVLCVAANRTAYSGDVCTYDHPHCKCNFTNGNVSVQIDFPIQKLTNYLFTDENKSEMMQNIGYMIEDSEELHQILSAVVKKQYEEGNYKLKTLNKNGQHVQFDIVIQGKRNHAGEMYRCRTGWVLWPYGKIKMASPIMKPKKIKTGG